MGPGRVLVRRRCQCWSADGACWPVAAPYASTADRLGHHRGLAMRWLVHGILEQLWQAVCRRNTERRDGSRLWRPRLSGAAI